MREEKVALRELKLEALHRAASKFDSLFKKGSRNIFDNHHTIALYYQSARYC